MDGGVDVEIIAGKHVQGGVDRKAKPERLRIMRIDMHGCNRIRARLRGLDSHNFIHWTAPRRHPRSFLHPFFDEQPAVDVADTDYPYEGTIVNNGHATEVLETHV